MIKRFDNLCSFENLYHAFVRARRGKHSQEVVARLERRLKAELFQMQEELNQ